MLITAGSTWTKIDDVRVMANIFTGNTGIKMAKHFAEMGAETTLLYNPRINYARRVINLSARPYTTFDGLKKAMEEEISSGRYDIVIHSAAVSDYGHNVKQLVEVKDSGLNLTPGMRLFKEVDDIPGKIKSDLPELTVTMGRTEKIVDLVKTWDPDVFLVKFKLEVDKTYEELIDIAEKSRVASNADLIVANDLHGAHNGVPPAIILGSDEIKIVDKRKLLASRVFNVIDWELKRREKNECATCRNGRHRRL